MSYRTVIVDRIVRKTSSRETEYLSIRFRSPVSGAYSWATVWDSALWLLMDQAKESGKPIVLDVVEDPKKDATGAAFLKVVGFEHPGQTLIPGVE